MHYQDWTGRIFDHYRLDELIGSGGMGAVYRAHQLNLERDVAVKVLTYTADEVAAQRFYREARTIAALEHPHIVPIYDYGARQDVSYIAMRLLTGGSLEDRLQMHKNGLPLRDIASIAQQLGSALDYAHQHSVVHRDIKGSNVLFDPLGSAYLVDFGIAKLIQGDDSNLTAEHLVMGTPTYMAPEIWQGSEFTPAADQYALGVLLFKMLVGMPPFMAASSYALMELHLRHPLPDIHELRPNIPQTVSRVLAKALAKNPAQRYASIGAFTEALQTALRGDLFAPKITEPPLDSGATVPSSAVSPSQVTQPHQSMPYQNRQQSSVPSPRSSYPQRTPPPPKNRTPNYALPPQQGIRPQPPQPRRNPYARSQGQPAAQHGQPQAVRERVIVRDAGQSPLAIVLWPFRLVWRVIAGIGGFIGSLIGTIIRQMLRSVVAFVMYLVLIITTVALVIAFLVALVAANFQVSEAFTLLITQLSNIAQGFLPQ